MIRRLIQRSARRRLCLALSLVLLSGQSLPGPWLQDGAATSDAQAATDWYMLKAGGRTIGSVRIETHRESIKDAPGKSPEKSRQGREAIITEISNVNRFQRQGEPFEMNTVSRFVEDPADMRPLQFSYSYDLGEQRLITAEGHIDGNRLRLQTISDTGATRGETMLNAVMANSQASEQNPSLQINAAENVVTNATGVVNMTGTGTTNTTGADAEPFVFPGGPGIEALYAAHYNDAPGSRFRFRTVNLGVHPQLVRSEATRIGPDTAIKTKGGKRLISINAPLVKFEIRNPDGQEPAISEWRDAHGKLYAARGQEMAQPVEMIRTSRQEAYQLQAGSAIGVDLINDMAILTTRIPQARMTHKAIYRIAPLTGRSVNLNQAFPQSDRQKIIESSGGELLQTQPQSLKLEVVSREAADSGIEYPVQIADTQYLQASPYMETTDPAIRNAAGTIVGNEKRAYYATRRLRQWVYENIRDKSLSLGFASAKETLLRRQGDCTEHAVLLAALSRSIGIPSRVAVGLIYLPQGNEQMGRFVYHMWTEVYIGDLDHGEWIPLDATNPEPLADATHIKMADSALSNSDDLMRLTESVTGLMGKLKIDVLQAVSPTQSLLGFGNQSGVMRVDIPKVDLGSVDIRTLSRKAIKHYMVQAVPVSFSLDTADGLFTRGVELLSNNDYDGAVTHFRQARSKLRQPLELYLLGEQLASIEMYGLATETFNAALNADPKLSPLVSGWINGYLPAVRLPDELNQHYIRAINLKSSSQAQQAATLLREVIQAAPRFSPAYRQLGEISKPDEAERLLNDAIAIAPADYRNPQALGDFLMERERYSEAANAYQNAYDALKRQAFAQSKPWLDLLAGRAQIAKGTALLTANPHNSQGWITMGRGLLLQNQLEDARTALQGALHEAPGSAEARNLMFLATLREPDWEALHTLSGGIRSLAGGNAFSGRLLGQYQIRLRQYPEAVHTLQRAIAMQPASADGYMTLSNAYVRLQEVRDQEHQAGKAVKNAPDYRKLSEEILKQGLNQTTAPQEMLPLRLQLAKLLLQHGKPEEALPQTEEALAISPLNVEALLAKGRAQLLQNELEGSRQTLSFARLLDANNAEALTGLGHIALENGQQSLALDFYRKAHKADPGNLEAAAAFRDLIGQMGVSIQKPPVYQALSDDEYDYLVQATFIARHQTDAIENTYTREYLAALQKYPSFRIADLRGIKRLENDYRLLNRTFDKRLAVYNQFHTLTPPPRLAAFHQEVLQELYTNLEWVQHALSRLTSSKSAQQSQQTADEEKSERRYSALEAQHSNHLDKAFDSLEDIEPTVFLRIMSEGQWSLETRNDTARLSAEIVALSNRIDGKELQEKQKKAPQSTPDNK